MTRYEKELEAKKRASTAQLLFKCARLVNERALETLPTDPAAPRPRPAQMALFPHIDLREGTRVTELAAKLGITKQAVGQLVDDLEAYGWMERRPDPDDGRAKRVHFTEHGKASMLDGLDHLQQIERELVRAVGKPVMASLHAALLELHDHLDPPES